MHLETQKVLTLLSGWNCTWLHSHRRRSWSGLGGLCPHTGGWGQVRCSGGPVAFLAYIVALNVLFLSFSLIMADSPLVGTTADSTKTPLKRALSEHKVLGIGGPQGLPSITHLSSLFFLSPLSFLPPLASLFAAPSLSSFSFLHSNLLWNWSELHIALFSTDLHVRGSRVIGV